VASDLDEACVALEGKNAAKAFVLKCRALRHWPRELVVKPSPGDLRPGPRRAREPASPRSPVAPPR
jgi:hypothetical protein